MNELKPCPWCGKQPELDGRSLKHFTKRCLIGHLHVIFEDQQQAINDWNKMSITNAATKRATDPGPYLTTTEKKNLERLLIDKAVLEDSFAVWRRTRLLGMSASMAVDGNISDDLLEVFDEIQELVLQSKKTRPS